MTTNAFSVCIHPLVGVFYFFSGQKYRLRRCYVASNHFRFTRHNNKSEIENRGRVKTRNRNAVSPNRKRIQENLLMRKSRIWFVMQSNWVCTIRAVVACVCVRVRIESIRWCRGVLHTICPESIDQIQIEENEERLATSHHRTRPHTHTHTSSIHLFI